MKKTQKRMGRFQIDANDVAERPMLVLSILAGCIPVRAEMMLHSFEVEYVAYGEHFDEIDRGDCVPEYKFNIRDLVGGKYHVTWERKR